METTQLELVHRYRKLLVAKPSHETLELAVHLLEEILGFRLAVRPSAPPLTQSTTSFMTADGGPRYGNWSAEFSEYALGFLTMAAEGPLSPQNSTENVRLEHLIVRSALALAVPGFLDSSSSRLPPARDSLAVDTSLVVFHQSFFVLFRPLPEPRLPERAFLEGIFIRFAKSLRTPADANRVLGLLADETGNQVLAEYCYEHALHATSPQSHEFMTMLQQLWSYYFEQRRYRAAIILLMQYRPVVGNQDLAEFGELVDLTMEASASGSR